MSMADVQEVRPEAIDVPEVISGADRWLAEQRAKVARIAEDFGPHEITSGEDYRQSKRERTAARRAIREVEDARRAQVGAIKDAIRGFEAEVRDLLAPLAGIDDGYKAALAEWERTCVDSRTQEVAAWYAETQGDVAAMVPFETLWQRYAHQEKWDLYGSNLVAIEAGVAEIVEHVIARDLETMAGMGYEPADAEALRAEYLRTLDLEGSCRRIQALREQRDRMAEVERQRRERMAEVEAERAKREAEAAQAERAWREAQAAQEPPCGPEAARTDICPQAPPAPATGVPVAPRQAAPAGPAPEPPADLRGQRVRTLVFEVEVPEHRAREFVAAMRAIEGVHGRKVGER